MSYVKCGGFLANIGAKRKGEKNEKTKVRK